MSDDSQFLSMIQVETHIFFVKLLVGSFMVANNHLDFIIALVYLSETFSLFHNIH